MSIHGNSCTQRVHDCLIVEFINCGACRTNVFSRVSEEVQYVVFNNFVVLVSARVVYFNIQNIISTDNVFRQSGCQLEPTSVDSYRLVYRRCTAGVFCKIKAVSCLLEKRIFTCFYGLYHVVF